jgi:putative DNA primase/helicase
VNVDMTGITRARTGTEPPPTPLYRQVKQYLEGGEHRWTDVLIRLGIPQNALSGKHGPCPGCGGKDRFRYDNQEGTGSFICSQGNGDLLAGGGWVLLEHVYGWTFERALAEVAHVLGLTDSPGLAHSAARPASPLATSPRSDHMPYSSFASNDTSRTLAGIPPYIPWGNLDAEAHRRYEYLGTLYHASTPLSALEGSALRMVRNYFASRGMGERFRLPPRMHFHPNLPNRKNDWTGPALIAWVTRPIDGPTAFEEHKVVGMQRIWINPQLAHGIVPYRSAKAPIPDAKQSFGIFRGSLVGSSVHLYGDLEKSQQRIIGEGIETVLAWLRLQVLRGTVPKGMEVHACLGTAQIKNWYAPTPKPTVLLQDNDPAGEQACKTFQALHANTQIQAPVSGCNDFNDFLISQLQRQRSASLCP